MVPQKMTIKPELGRFLFQNMFAHDPCHDFSPAGGGKRMYKLNSRFDQVNKMFNTPALGGGDIKVQSGGKLADLNPIQNIDLAVDYGGINGSEAVGTYSGFEADGAINTVTSIITPTIKQIIVDRYEFEDDKARVRDVLSIMATTINAVMPKDDSEAKQTIQVSHNTRVNEGEFIFRASVGTVTRSAENFRRVYINKMQEVIAMNDYVRLTIVMHNVVAPADTTATVIAAVADAAVADAAVADAAVDARVGFDPVYGGKAYNSRTILRPPPSPNSTKNKEEYAAKLRLLKKMSTLAPGQARSSNKVPPRSTKNNGIEMPILAQALASTSELAEPEQASTPAAVPPSGNTYTNMYLILDHLYNEYEDAKSSLAANDEVADLSESLDDMKNVIKFYRFAFEYYTTHIENMSSMYSVNNSDFIKDSLLYYFIDLYANRYNSDALEPSKLMSDDDAAYRNSVFEILYMLRKPIKKEMGGGNGKIMTGGSPKHYTDAVNLVNAIPLVDCLLNGAKYTITWSNPDPALATQEIVVTDVAADVNTTLIAINEKAKKHLLAFVSEEWLPVVKDGIKAKVDAAFNKDDQKSLWNKEHKGQLHRFLIRGANQRNGDKAIKAQLDRLITDVKSQMLNVLRLNDTAIKAIAAEVVDTTPGTLSVTAKYVANGFLKQLCSTIRDNCKQEPPAPPPAGVKVNNLYDTQDKILNKIIEIGPYPNLDSDLLAGFVKAHTLTSDLNVALKQSCLVNTPNIISNNVIVKTLRNGMAGAPQGTYRRVNIINNALMSKYRNGGQPEVKYVDHLVNTYNGTADSGDKGIKFENMCPVTCVLDAMGSFGSCSNGQKSDKYNSLKFPTQMFIETPGDVKKFEFNMTTRHKNNVVIVEYYLIYNGFTVSNCVIEATIKESAVNILSANNTFADVLNYIEQNAPTNPTEQMNWQTFFTNHSANIVRIISRKMIGDFGQELSAVYPIGGYGINMPGKLAAIRDWTWPATAIAESSELQFILKTNGDRPSFVREAHMLLAEPDQTNENTVIMYLGDTNGIVVMSNKIKEYLSVQAGGALQTKRTPHTKKRTTRNHKRTRKISARKTRRLKRNP